ncbi:MAG: peptide ABC transporter substrate-binding protein [Chloroflexi bacterium]|nr:peptide ABC transporter substrate-binding protein [Chloroflexota bacterium]
MNKFRNAPVSLLSVLIVLSLLLAACPAPGAAPAAQAPAATEATTVVTDTTPAAAASGDAMTTVFGTKLPDDAAPYDEQIYTTACSNTANMTTMDFAVSVYTRYCLSDLFQDTLIDLDKDFNVKPASAEKWEVAADGLTWTFHIKPGLVWSDGTPVTAHDWVATYQYEADPKHAWDFTWFYAGVIKNWDEVVAGEVPSTTLGITAPDDLSLQIVTTKPFPPLPGMMKFSFLMQKAALEKYGPFYNNDPKTSVSAGPFKLVSLEPGKKIVLTANETYKGFRQPRLKGYVGIFMDLSQAFESFKKGEINDIGYETLTPADFELIQKDPVLSKNYLRGFGDFRTDYLLFDTFNPPFNDLNVRKAFAHAVDREAIVKNVYGEIKAMPAYAMLMPGFPSSDTKGDLKQYQNYDCAAAQKYLADAGFAEGKGFPSLELWLRNEQPALQAVFQAVAASIADCLKVQIEVSNKDQKVYMDSLNAKPTKITIGAISYGMDYLDPTNMLGIWVSTGRHSWKNEEFDKLIAEATPLVGDAAKRDQMFRDAEKILVDDVGGVFIDHRWQGTLYQPYVQGDSIRVPDSNGISGPHWGNDWVNGNIYIAKH